MVSSFGPLDVVSPVNFPLKALLRALKKNGSMKHPPLPHWLLKDGNHYSKVQSHFNWIVGLPTHYMLQCCHSQAVNKLPREQALAGGSNSGKRNTRRRGVYTQETATTEGKWRDEKRLWTSSCHPCRSYMRSTACSWKSVMIVHALIGWFTEKEDN
jgi:hypothetical protein